MQKINLTPLAGMDNASPDADLQIGGDAPRVYLRDAINVDIGEGGRARMRAGLRLETATPLANLWQSPLHGDVFGTVGPEWVKVSRPGWGYESLAQLGDGYASHLVLNNAVIVAGPNGIYRFDGSSAQRLTIDTPPAPMVSAGSGALVAGNYSVAVAWVRADGTESGLSSATACHVGDGGGLSVVLPLCMDPTIVTARVYATSQNGSELRRLEDLPVSRPDLDISSMAGLGRAAMFAHMSPMRTGRYLGLWRGRLLTATANVLRFSQALAYHLHDARHDFVQMPQRITFVQPVDGGIWVGQVDHVAFLAGTSPENLEYGRRQARAPVPGTAIALKAEEAGELSAGGQAAVLWLADNGFVLGSPDGQLVEAQARRIKGVRGTTGTCVVFDRRVLAALV
ncbi:hypothetical protein ACQYWY_06765 [Comamonas sediminis]|uniref:hypothetical protein n=1 Tax=Comamonas sediminis TaxID=1783360 RepID=UPI003D2BC896